MGDALVVEHRPAEAVNDVDAPSPQTPVGSLVGCPRPVETRSEGGDADDDVSVCVTHDEGPEADKEEKSMQRQDERSSEVRAEI